MTSSSRSTAPRSSPSSSCTRRPRRGSQPSSWQPFSRPHPACGHRFQGSWESEAMIGRRKANQARLFYAFSPGERVAAAHPLRRIDVFATAALADVHQAGGFASRWPPRQPDRPALDRPGAGRSHPACRKRNAGGHAGDQPATGGTLCSKLKTFSGSYLAFTWRSRSRWEP